MRGASQFIQRGAEGGDEGARIGEIDPMAAGADHGPRQVEVGLFERPGRIDHCPGRQRHDLGGPGAIGAGDRDCGCRVGLDQTCAAP